MTMLCCVKLAYSFCSLLLWKSSGKIIISSKKVKSISSCKDGLCWWIKKLLDYTDDPSFRRMNGHSKLIFISSSIFMTWTKIQNTADSRGKRYIFTQDSSQSRNHSVSQPLNQLYSHKRWWDEQRILKILWWWDTKQNAK